MGLGFSLLLHFTINTAYVAVGRTGGLAPSGTLAWTAGMTAGCRTFCRTSDITASRTAASGRTVRLTLRTAILTITAIAKTTHSR